MLNKLSAVVRLIALSILFGGSISIIVAAVTLVKAAEAQGIPVAQAASANAPVFLVFSKIALGAGFALLFAEALNYAQNRNLNKAMAIRYIASFACVATTMIFAFGFVPPMEELRPRIATDEQAHAQFKKLHENSRIVFGGTILFALISLVIPALGCAASGNEAGKPSP
jgi:hypothetical protein